MKLKTKKILDLNDCIHCKTKEEAILVLRKASSLGFKWSNGASFNDIDSWNKYKSDTHYFICDGTFGGYDHDCRVISVEDFLKNY